jgi:hypothetical protein
VMKLTLFKLVVMMVSLARGAGAWLPL